MHRSWNRVAAVSDCMPGRGIEVVVEDRLLAIFNVDGTFYALDGVCPHQGGPLAKGTVVGCIVTCPWHGWQFDVTTGQHQLNVRLKQPAFAVRVEGDSVFISIDNDSSDGSTCSADSDAVQHGRNAEDMGK